MGNQTDLDPNPDFANYYFCAFGQVFNLLSLFLHWQNVNSDNYFVGFIEKSD